MFFSVSANVKIDNIIIISVKMHPNIEKFKGRPQRFGFAPKTSNNIKNFYIGSTSAFPTFINDDLYFCWNLGTLYLE